MVVLLRLITVLPPPPPTPIDERGIDRGIDLLPARPPDRAAMTNDDESPANDEPMEDSTNGVAARATSAERTSRGGRQQR